MWCHARVICTPTLPRAVIMLLIPFLLAAQLGSGSPRPSLRTTRDVKSLTNTEAKLAYPVQLEGTATYVDQEWGILFLTDETGPIFINAHGVATPFRAGARLRVRGVTGAGNMAPVLVRPTFEVLGQCALRAPKQIDLTAIDRGTGDSEYVLTRGVLRHGFPAWNRVTFRLFDGTDWIAVIVPENNQQAAERLIGATVRVRGTAGARLDSNGKRVGAQLFVSHLADIEVEEAEPQDLLSKDPRLITTIRTIDIDQRFVHAVHIRGLVTWGRPGLFFVRDISGVVCVETEGDPEIEPGTSLDVLGFPANGEYGLTLSDSRLRKHLKAPRATAPPTLQLTPEEAIARQLNGQPVHLRARLVRQMASPAEHVFLLDDGGQQFTAQLRRADAAGDVVRLPIGSMLELTGAAIVRSGVATSSASLLVLLRSPADIVLLKAIGWWTTEKLLTIAGGLVFIIVTVLAWVTQLRRTVRRQTATIQARLDREIQLQDQYRRLFERNLAAVFRWQPDGTILDCNPAFARMLGFESTSDVVNRSYWDFRHDTGEREQLLRALAGEAQSNRDSKLLRSDGTTICLLENITPVHTGEKTFYETTAIDVTQLRQHQADLQRARDIAIAQALNDALTGLPNRRFHADRLADMLTEAQRNSHRVALLYIDLDGFKLVNDSHGHAIGDALLVQVANRLQGRVRRGDILARLGGDEFTVVVGDLHAVGDALAVATDLLHLLVLPFNVQGHDIEIGASIGISIFPDHAASPSELLQHADNAMYSAKRSGRNRVQMFTPELGAAQRERLTLETQLRGAVGRGEISVHYQPEFDVVSGRLIRFEALARWTHGTLGSISPERFIPVAEDSGLIIALGAYIMEQACTEAVKWQSLWPHPVQLAVNVSSVQLQQEGFPEEVIDILHRTGFSPQLLQIELTESVMLKGIGRCASVIRRLKELGIGLAIDDFGTGYSSLSYLQALPFDALKIDRSFIREAVAKPEGEAMIGSLIALAHNVGLRVIVEGIEQPEQLRIVERFGGNEVQGYFMGRPVAEPRRFIELRRALPGLDEAAQWEMEELARESGDLTFLCGPVSGGSPQRQDDRSANGVSGLSVEFVGIEGGQDTVVAKGQAVKVEVASAVGEDLQRAAD